MRGEKEPGVMSAPTVTMLLPPEVLLTPPVVQGQPRKSRISKSIDKSMQVPPSPTVYTGR